MMAPVLELKAVSKVYGGQTVFRNLNFRLDPGETIGLLGKSGAGKSTLLKMAAGLTPPTRGEVTVRARRIGYVFQEPRLLPWYSALENICLVLLAAGIRGDRARDIAQKFLNDMGLTGFEHHFPGQLSGGMNQRVSIARALAVSPELLLLDEPFTGLDVDTRRSVRERMADALGTTRAAVIHVTHARDELLPSVRNLFILSANGITQTG